MISLKKLLKSRIYFSVLLLVFVASCSKEPEKKDFVAKVNDSYLTQNEFEELDSMFNKSISKNEIIKRWIEKELLYQEAVKTGITENDDFIRIINNSKKELATSLFIKKYLDEKTEKPSRNDIAEFYEKYKNDFRSREKVYVYNFASFRNENSAIKFRTKVFDERWAKAIENVEGDSALISYSSGKAKYRSEIYPLQLVNMIDELNPGEVSIILQESMSKFTLVQLEQVIQQGQIPPLEIIKDQVEDRLMAERQQELINEFKQKLYSSSEIEIK
jgi:hypothetical protein